MSCPVNLTALPSGVLEEVFTPETVRGRAGTTSVSQLSIPKSRSALWDCSPAGEKLRLQLCSHRKPHLVLSEKALRLAHRHVRHSNKPRLLCFFLGSVSVNSDEDRVTVTLDRFDPGRDQSGSSGRVPSALLPGDVLVPCLFSMQMESPDTVVQSEAELHQCFRTLQQSVSGRQTLDLSQLLKVRGHVVWSQQLDASSFTLSWSAVCPSVTVDVQPVRAVPIIPTALLRSLTAIGRPPYHATNPQRGFLSMDQTRKLVLLLESDPKAANLPLVGLWISGVTHIYNPQVFVWCLRFLFSSALQDRVFSDSGCFLLVLFASTHRAPQFFQCRGPGPGPHLDCELLTAFQSVSLYQQVAPVDGRSLQCELIPQDQGQQVDVFRDACRSFNSAPPPPLPAGLSISDQDSGVEDEDLSPRPSPSPHLPVQQTRRVQPSVPELSLLIDSSFLSNHNTRHDPGSTHRAPPPAVADRKCVNSTSSSSSAPRTAPPPHLHSTPNSNLPPTCSCCSSPYSCTSIFPSPACPPPPSSHHHTPPHSRTPPSSHHSPPPSTHHHHNPPPTVHLSTAPSCTCSHPPPHPSQPADPASPPWLPCPPPCVGGVTPSDTYQLLLRQDQQLRLLQAQVQMLLEAQGKLQSCSQDTQTSKCTASIAVGTGVSLLWADPVQPLPHQEVQAPSPSPSAPPSSSSSTSSSHDLSNTRPESGPEDSDITHQTATCSPCGQQSSILQSPGSVSMCRATDGEQTFYHNLMTQLTSRLQESDSRQEVEDEEEPRRRQSLSAVSDHAHSSSSRSRRRSLDGASVMSATLRQLQQLGVDVDQDDLSEADRSRVRAVESVSTLASINPAAVVSRLSVPDPSVSALLPGASVDLSLEANAIALRYLSDSQLSRLSVGGHAPRPGRPASSSESLLSPSNMSLATRKYMRRYGLIEEEEEDEEEEAETRPPLTNPLNVKLLPQSQLIRDLRPKMQALATNAKVCSADKENSPGRQPSLMRASSRQTEASLGNILDLSRLRQLPKLF